MLLFLLFGISRALSHDLPVDSYPVLTVSQLKLPIGICTRYHVFENRVYLLPYSHIFGTRLTIGP